MSKHLPKLFLFFMCALFFSTCIKEKDYPTTPVIKFKSFINYGLDSADLTISFTDGDGDIGLSKEDTIGDFSINGGYYYNLYARYLYKDVDGVFKIYELAPGDTLEHPFRIPKLLKEGQQLKALSGDIRMRMQYPITLDDTTRTIQFDIYIYDRALHKSNVVNTGTIILN